MIDWICPKCMMVLCKPRVTQAEALKVFNRHLREKHSVKTAKFNGDKVKLPDAGSRRSDNQANQKATEKSHRELRRAEVRDSSPRSEPNFLPDSEWDASTQGNIAVHQSPRKTGSDGFSIYGRTMYGKGVLDTLLKHPEMMRKARGHLLSCSVPAIAIQAQKLPTPKPSKVEIRATANHQGEDSAVKVQMPAENRPDPSARSNATIQLSLQLMKRLREINAISGNPTVVHCCSDAELVEAQELCHSVAARLNKHRSK